MLWKEAHPKNEMCSTKRRSIHPQLLHSSERFAVTRVSKEKGQIPLLVTDWVSLVVSARIKMLELCSRYNSSMLIGKLIY